MSELEARTDRRAQIAPGTAAGVTEAMIRRLVPAFYGRIRRDPELGPIFDAAIGEHWDEHLAKLCDFWSSVTLMTGRFKGSPMAAHARRPAIQPEHFARWLAIWGETVRELCPPAAAALFVEKAEMIGRSLKLGLAVSRGEIPPLTS
jgi:hemoglobin